MPNKLQAITELLIFSTKQSTATVEDWKSFLTSSAWHYTAIPAGHYTMIETVAPAGYALSSQTYSFDIDENGNITGDINITDEPTALIIDKINAFTGEPFAGIEFTLMNANGEIVKTVMTENGWRVPSDRGEESFFTDKNGHVEFRYG